MKQGEHIDILQFGALSVCFLMGTILRTTFINYITDYESWVTSILGAVGFFPVMLVYLWLARKHPGMSLFEINEAVLGPVAGRVLSVLYLMFFLMLAALNYLEVGKFVSGYMIQGSPMLVVLVALSLAVTYVLRKGIEPLARLVVPLVVGAMALLLINSLHILPVTDFGNLLPLFQHTPAQFLQSTHVAMAIPYGESMTMLALLPLVRGQGDVKKPLIANLCLTCAIMVLVHVREAVTLGPLLTVVTLPSYEVVRMIDTGSVLARSESIYAMLLTTLTFVKVCVVVYACVTGLAHVTRVRDHKPLLGIVCAYLAVYATAFQGTLFNNIQWTVNVTPIIWTAFEYVLPLGTAAVAWFQRFGRGRKEAAQA
jgi:spore germination protein KB